MTEIPERQPTTNHPPSECLAKPCAGGDNLRSLIAAALAESQLQSKLLMVVAFEQAYGLTTAKLDELTPATLAPIPFAALLAWMAWSRYRKSSGL